METIKLPVNMGGEISPALMNMLLDKASRALGYQVNQIDGIYSVSVHSPKYSGTSRCMSKCSIELAASQNGMGSERVTLSSIPASSKAMALCTTRHCAHTGAKWTHRGIIRYTTSALATA